MNTPISIQQQTGTTKIAPNDYSASYLELLESAEIEYDEPAPAGEPVSSAGETDGT